MTGAVMPECADTVVMQEQAKALDDDHVRFEPPFRMAANVRAAGEDLRQGEVMLASGRWLMPADIGLLASVGMVEVSVCRRLRVGVLSTGDEVRGLGEQLTPGVVYDSNRYQLWAALRRMGVEVCDLGIVRDDPGDLVASLRAAATHLDMIVSSGGVSSGAADLIRDVVADIGRINLWRVAMKPGRPLAFGSVGKAIFFGLPGNPVAALVAFCWFVKPVLEKRMGVLDRPMIPLIDATVDTPLRKQPGRMEFQRGVLTPRPEGEGYRVRTTGDQGSGILRSMSLANGLIVLPEAEGPVAAGSRVAVLPFSSVF
jgi:molybdopterin molybdotransferase